LTRGSAIAAEPDHEAIIERLIRIDAIVGAVKGRCKEKLPDNTHISCCAKLRDVRTFDCI
jgi:hypothetical protein